VREQPVLLEWAPGTAGARILVEVDISHHGGQTGQIDCVADDGGSLEIASGLVTQLLDLGYAGFPSLKITRTRIGSTQTERGTVELRTASSHVLSIEIEGLTSCTEVDSDAECPEGQLCLPNRSCG
jgi:hypothetical protein